MKNIEIFIVFLAIIFSPSSSFASTDDVEKRVHAAEARAVSAEKRAMEAEQRALDAEKELNKTKQNPGIEPPRKTPEKRTKNKVWCPPF